MAVYYNREKSKLGSNTGSIITFAKQLSTTDPADADNKKMLPSGYLRCDGTVYSANIYPILAEVLGTGSSCKFKKEGITLRDDQFQVPDLGSKFIRASTGANAGTFTDLTVTNASGNTEYKSGIGLDVLSNIGSTYTLEYRGSFTLPSQQTLLRGQPGFSRSTGTYTESTEVPSTGFQPHAHFSVGTRSRTANAGGINDALTQKNTTVTRSTLAICPWFRNTRQELCKLAAGRQAALSSSNQCANCCNAYYVQVCTSGCTFASGTAASCLIPTGCSGSNITSSGATYPVGGTGGGYSPTNPTRTVGNITYTGTGYLSCTSTCLISGCTVGGPISNIPSSQTLASNYTALNVPYDSQIDSSSGFAGVSNTTTETTAKGNTATHRHQLPFTQTAHTYYMRTDAVTIPADGLSSVITVRTNSAKKADEYIQPYIIVEYLIKT